MNRADFIKELPQYPAEKLVYIDESGIDEFISRENGWGAKGAKVIGETHYWG